jgi:hypothetical protein
VADLVEGDVPLGPVPVALLGPRKVVTRAQGLAQAVEALGLAVERADAGWDGNEG